MAKEIEKKYLLREAGTDHTSSAFKTYFPEGLEELTRRALREGDNINQGYLSLWDGQALCTRLGIAPIFDVAEARLRDKAGTYTYTLKGKGGVERDELETQVTEAYFNMLWPRTENNRLQKTRLKLPHMGYTLEIDQYLDRDLVTAEIEFPTKEEAASLVALGQDVTRNPAYKNRNLAT